MNPSTLSQNNVSGMDVRVCNGKWCVCAVADVEEIDMIWDNCSDRKGESTHTTWAPLFSYLN